MKSMMLATIISAFIMGVSGETVFEDAATVAAQASEKKTAAPITEQLEEEEAGEQSFEDAFKSLDSMVDKMDVVAKEAKDSFPDTSSKQPQSTPEADAPSKTPEAEPSPETNQPAAMTEVDAVLAKADK